MVKSGTYIYFNEVKQIMSEETIKFTLGTDKNKDLKEKLDSVYDALLEKGYNPINQIAGYVVSGDPTYITTHNDARNLMQKIDRYELLKSLIKFYLSN